jgi:hypothetical protein
MPHGRYFGHFGSDIIAILKIQIFLPKQLLRPKTVSFGPSCDATISFFFIKPLFQYRYFCTNIGPILGF